jgi:integrase
MQTNPERDRKGVTMAHDVKRNKGARQRGKNDQEIYRFLKREREARGRKELTIRKIEYALSVWRKLMPGHDLKDGLNTDVIVEFKERLRGCDNMCAGTRYDILRHVRDFFEWLSQQPGYRSKVKVQDLAYFHASAEERNYRYCREPEEYPTLTQIKSLCRSIGGGTLIVQRDRAMIAYLYLSGSRIDAAASTPLGCLNARKGTVDQNPKKGVRTKFSKQIITVLFPLDDGLMQVVQDWHATLDDMGYGNSDPLFPRAEPAREGLAFIQADNLSREPLSASGMRAIVKKRFLEAGMKYYHPHTFRHACIGEAIERAKDSQELKAISQNVGHDEVNYIINTYGQLPQQTLFQCIKNLGRGKDGEDEE